MGHKGMGLSPDQPVDVFGLRAVGVGGGAKIFGALACVVRRTDLRYTSDTSRNSSLAYRASGLVARVAFVRLRSYVDRPPE